jgi:hypothetical protein
MLCLDLDIGIQKLLTIAVNNSTIPVSKSQFVPSYDMRSTPNGFVYFDTSAVSLAHSSEGMQENGSKEVGTFTLDIGCVAHDVVKRKTLMESVVNTLQPVVAGVRTQLTSYLVPTTTVFINYLRLMDKNETAVLKEGQSNPDQTVLILIFSGKATC